MQHLFDRSPRLSSALIRKKERRNKGFLMIRCPLSCVFFSVPISEQDLFAAANPSKEIRQVTAPRSPQRVARSNAQMSLFSRLLYILQCNPDTEVESIAQVQFIVLY